MRSIKEKHVPPGTHGWALLAKGMAWAERVETPKQLQEIENANKYLQEVVDMDEPRPTDKAAALLHLSRLYSRIGDSFRASLLYRRAEPLVEASEHGWLKDLLETARASLTGDVGFEMRINVEELLRAANERKAKPWVYVNEYIEADLKRRLLALDRHQEILKEPDGETRLADELGVGRATIFLWKKDPKLAHAFPQRKGTRKR
jgi:hypothetical protein